MTTPWPHCLVVASDSSKPGGPAGRLPFVIDGQTVGSVALAHLPALRAWPDWLAITPQAIELTVEAARRNAALDSVHRALRADGRLRGWRDETVEILAPEAGPVLALIERAAARFWGTLTFGAHATGYVADAAGRPTQLWIAQRALSKATDPGLFDNLIGGGVAHGQTPAQALVREGFEEAGLQAAEMQGARAASVLRLQREVREGWQHEWLHSFDVELPPGRVPHNQDGEVAGFRLLPVAEALALAWGDGMTVDAALVTLDFAVRHHLLGDPALAEALRALRVVRPG